MQAFCTYCGAKVLIHNENEFIFRNVDEAGIKQAETDRMIRMRELELEEKSSSTRKVLMVIWLIVTLILLTIAVGMMFSEGNEDMPGWAAGFLFLFYACAPIIGGGAHLVFHVLPEKEEERKLAKMGGIRFPDGLSPFSEKQYTAIVEALKSAGFQNVRSVNLHDLNLITALVSNGKADRITVNGKDITSGGKMFMPDAAIVITYHGR